MNRPFICDIKVATGSVIALGELTDSDVVAHRDALRSAGMTCAAVLDEPSVELAAGLLRAMAEEHSEDVTVVVYATEELADTTPADLVGTILRSAPGGAAGFIVSGNGCANLGPALLSAAALSADTGPVAVVTADRARPGMRVMADSMTLLGDAAGVCTVTAAPPGRPGFELVAARSTAWAAAPGPRRTTMALRAMIDGVRAATTATLDAAGWTAGEVAGMVVGEYSAGARRFLAHASGVSRQFLPTTAAGHCHSVDVLRGLAVLVEDEVLADGTPLLALASGPTSWTVLALRYRAR